MHQEPPGKAGAAASEYDPAACETWIFARLFEALRAGLPQSDAARSDLQVQQADALSLLRRASALFDVGEDALAPYALFACPAFMLSTEEAGVAALRTAYPIEEWDEAGSLRQMISSFLSADLVDMSWILDTWREAILQDFSASMQTTLERVLPLGPKLGKGAYGTVHLVQRAGRLFAVKTSRCSSLFDQRAQRLLAKNPHKHIVKQELS